MTHADPVRQRLPDGDLPGGQPGLRAPPAGHVAVLRGPGGDRADPVHRRQHQLQRLPVPGQLRRRGLVPAPLADQARPPAGVLQRDHRADRRWRWPCCSPSARNVNNLVPFYAIGVFTGFTMAGFGMARYHRSQREPGWRRRLVINLTGGVYTALVVLIFAVVKFTEGAWLVVIVFPIGVFALIRLNRQYRTEAAGPGEHRRAPGLRRASAAAELHPPGRHRLRRRLRPGHPGRAAVRQEPAADRRCARCTSSSTASRPSELRAAWLPRPQRRRWSSSTAPTGG